MAADRNEFLKGMVLKHLEFIDRLASKRFPKADLAKEATAYILDELASDDWRRVESYKGNSSFTTFLGVVVKRLLNDFARKKYGRVRPPEWLKKQGSLWVQVFRLLCLERRSVEDTVYGLTGDEQRKARIVEEAVSVILSRITDCGKYSGEAAAMDEDAIDAENTAVHPGLHTLMPDEALAARERVFLMEVIARLLSDQAPPPQGNRLLHRIQKLQDRVRLTPEERLLLRTVYQEGFSVSAAGRMLGWNANKTSGRHRRLLERIRQAMDASGLAAALKELL